MDINKAMSICLAKELKIFPEFVEQLIFVAVQYKNLPIKLSKSSYTSLTINQAVYNTWIKTAEKLITKNNEK
jgi:hypothetical protein